MWFLVWLPKSFLNLLDSSQECFINDSLASPDPQPELFQIGGKTQHSARLSGVWFRNRLGGERENVGEERKE